MIKNNRSQVTIFIILALILVVVIVMIFVLIRGREIEVVPGVADVENPQAYIESCVNEFVEEAVEIMMPQGGDIEPTNYKEYNNENIRYLCYNRNYYYPCINQEPLLIEHLEKEIMDYTEDKIENCFQGLKQGLIDKNYDIEMGSMMFDVRLKHKQIVVNINRAFEMSKRGDDRNFKSFNVNIVSPLYNLGKIAGEIVNQETRFCNFEYLGYMIFYPEYNINKIVLDDDADDVTKDDSDIYIIKDKNTQKEFKFAVRSCAPRHGFI